MKPRVFVVQDQRVRRGVLLVSKFDLTPASVFGDLVFVLSPDARPYHAQSVIDEIHQNIRSITTKDHVLLVGNPVLIGWVTAIAAYYLKGNVRCLQWEQLKKSYIPVSGELFAFS